MFYCKGIDIEAWKYSSKNKTTYLCQDLLSGKINLQDAVNKSPNLLMNYNRLRINLEAFNLDKKQDNNTVKKKENLWIYGPPGCGKTFYATHLYTNYFLKSQNIWWDGYKGEDVVIIDDFDNRSLSHYLKIWADNYVTQGEIKNGTIYLNFTKLIITSNYMPMGLWPNDKSLQFALYRRFKFISVHGQYPNFSPIDIPNPIQNNF